MAQSKLEWTDVDSSNVHAIAYDEDTKTLCVQFHNGGLYSYTGVLPDVYVDFVHAESVGKYLNQAIKGAYPYFKWFNEQDMLTDIESRKVGGR